MVRHPYTRCFSKFWLMAIDRIFIIEGLLTIIAASVAFWVIAPWPEDAKFLTTDEKALLLKRLALDRGNAKVEILNVRAFKNALADWKIWIGYGNLK